MFLAVTKARGLGRGRKARRLQFIDKGSSQVSRPDLLGAVVYLHGSLSRALGELRPANGKLGGVHIVLPAQPRRTKYSQALRLRLEQSPSRHGGDYVFRRRQRMRCLTEGSGAFKTRGLHPQLLNSPATLAFFRETGVRKEPGHLQSIGIRPKSVALEI